MGSSPVSEFWSLVQRDAVVQERAAQAAKQPEPLVALVAAGASSGFHFSVAELQAHLAGALGDGELDQVAGGLASSKEMFAELYSVPIKTG